MVCHFNNEILNSNTIIIVESLGFVHSDVLDTLNGMLLAKEYFYITNKFSLNKPEILQLQNLHAKLDNMKEKNSYFFSLPVC